MSELRMPAVNQITVAGRLTQEPEFRLTENGVARLSGRIAVNRSYRDRDGEWQDEVSFFNFIIWQAQAERLADRLSKGAPVLLSGRLRSHSWRDEEENPHSLVEIQVRHLQVLSRSVAADSPDLTAGSQDVSEFEEAEEEILELAA
ncbi:MAG: single-stranded DNA-binding protein [Gemmatimonadetes bacterium]|jgi:single-strand DNA-binding protein|nr:single-stranded DNA-binding protein [Gemmatimonadota bacterium]MBT6150313.1 single-stranded DNA-binding protein [Gemmatimonadota bacterium]MBT7859645.1 single-stranded DNA-binding protein [Gemmatimonadota bacterium]